LNKLNQNELELARETPLSSKQRFSINDPINNSRLSLSQMSKYKGAKASGGQETVKANRRSLNISIDEKN
jgi:hypothetical protein